MARTLKTPSLFRQPTLLRHHLKAQTDWHIQVAQFFKSLKENPEAAKAIKRNHAFGVGPAKLRNRMQWAVVDFKTYATTIGTDTRGIVILVWWKPTKVAASNVRIELPAGLVGYETEAIKWWNDKADTKELSDAQVHHNQYRALKKRFDKPKGIDVAVVADYMAVK